MSELYRVHHDRDGKHVQLVLHPGQWRAWESLRRYVFVISGTQAGKTSFGPWWLYREIYGWGDFVGRGAGDYLAATATYDLFKLKMLPVMRYVFENVTNRARFWPGDGILELMDPIQKKFLAKSRTDPMWGRIILRAASSPGGLESTTANAAWLDECVAPETLIATEIGQIPISRLVRERLAVRVWSYDTARGQWELLPIRRWIRLPQRKRLDRLGALRLTADHKIWTRERGYVAEGELVGDEHVLFVRALWPSADPSQAEALLQQGLLGSLACRATGIWGAHGSAAGAELSGKAGATSGDIRAAKEKICRRAQSSVGADWRGDYSPSSSHTERSCQAYSQRPSVGGRGKWPPSKLEAGEAGSSVGLAQRVCCGDRGWLAPARLQDRRGGARDEDCHRGRECGEPSQERVVRAEWVDVSALLESNGRAVDGGLSGDGYVYNLEVEGNHNYVADGILVANCGQHGFGLAAWEAVQRRLSLAQGRVLGTTTPYNLGWLKTEVYDRWEKGDTDYDVIQFASTENPAFPLAEMQRAERTMVDWKFRMFYRGLFERPEGLILSAWDEDTMLVDPFEIPQNWTRYIGMDFGPVHTALIWGALNPETDELFIYEESMRGGLTTPEHGKAAVDRIVAQGSPAYHAYGGAGSEDQWRRDLQAVGWPIRKPAIGGVEEGIDRIIRLMKGSKFRIMRGRAPMLREEINTYSRKLNAAGEPTNEIENKSDYHMVDGLRYLVAGMLGPKIGMRWFNEPTDGEGEELATG